MHHPHSQLCRLIHHSLRPFAYLQDESAVFLSKDIEKRLLIALSQVFREIQLWIHEFDCDSDTNFSLELDMMVEVPARSSKCSADSKPLLGDHDCLTGIIGDLVLLLSIENQYVQHLAGNILVVISDYIILSGSNWDDFMQSFCVCLELVISNALLHSLEQQTKNGVVLNCDLSIIAIALKQKMKNANWSSVACVVQVLRNILKHLKRDFDNQLLEVYLDSVGSCLSNVPWNSINDLHISQNGEALKVLSGDALYTKATQLDARVVFYGTLVQFFCSLVNQSGRVETAGGSFNKHPVLREINNLIPRLLAWCLSIVDQKNASLSEYFRHKILMLMIRLSSQNRLKCSLLSSWLQLIHKYFEDLLLLPVTPTEFQQDSLEGSPFLVGTTFARTHNMSSTHLQRLAVFLFLRCSFSLVGLGEEAAEHCGCANLNTSTNHDSNTNPECCRRKEGLSELYGWLRQHLPAETFVGYEFYYERCIGFSISFLRLFIHEDDILFEVLLQLFYVPFHANLKVCQDRCAFHEMKDDILFHISNLFNPLHLFHLFLAELHYDHQVLLDYLISKDTGASSAEYLLRSLRVVCDSLDEFLEFKVEGKFANVSNIYKLSRKKRKVLVDGPDFQGHVTSSTVKSTLTPRSLGDQCQKGLMHARKRCKTNRLPFECAKNCLLSLKNSLQNLHEKNLFPYNPEVLLRRLKRFEELCIKQLS